MAESARAGLSSLKIIGRWIAVETPLISDPYAAVPGFIAVISEEITAAEVGTSTDARS
jgi:hypothetical protein